MNQATPSTPEDFAALARALVETHGVLPTLRGVVASALSAVPCDWAAVAVTDHLTDRPARLAASSERDLLARVGEIAAAAGTSPGISAFQDGRLVCCPDLKEESRYPQYAHEMLTQTPIRTVVSLPLQLQSSTVGVMSLYARTAHAFSVDAMDRARVLSAHAVIAIQAARLEDQAENLELGLARARTIGAAIGILMERYKLTSTAAFARLRRASQDTNHKLASLAEDLVETGTAPGLDDWSSRTQPTHEEAQPRPGSASRSKDEA